MPLYQVFVYLTQAFDTINRDAFWRILSKIECPPSFIDKFGQLHRNVKAQVNFNGQLSEQISVDNGVKQGGIPAPTLFSIYLSAILWFAFHNCNLGMMICFRTTGQVFDLRRFNAKSKTSDCLVRKLLYVDDPDLVAHSVEDMQDIMDRFANACKCFGLIISLDKTKVMLTPALHGEYVEPEIYVYATRSKVLKSFVDLGSSMANNGFLDVEIKERISKASVVFGNLENRVWSDRNITINTKLAVYESLCADLSFIYL